MDQDPLHLRRGDTIFSVQYLLELDGKTVSFLEGWERKEGSLGEPACGQLTVLVVVPAVGAPPALEARGGEGLTRGGGWHTSDGQDTRSNLVVAVSYSQFTPGR